MNEKIYKTMGRIGGSNIAVGILLIVVGVAAGVVTIVNGAKLFRKRGEITF